jgi:hypothetical protein
MLSELQSKLIRLALDPAAHQGEIQNCAIKLIESWRREGKRLEDLFGDHAQEVQKAQAYWAPDFGLCTMKFGKHKDKEFKDIPPSYFHWLLPELKKPPRDPKYAASNERLIGEIESFLKQY